MSAPRTHSSVRAALTWLRTHTWLSLCLFLAASVVAPTAYFAWHEYRALRPVRVTQTPKADALVAERGAHVKLTTSDGVELAGVYIPPSLGKRAAVLLVHGYGGNRDDVMPEAKLLRDAGFAVLALDTRAHGKSGGERTTYGDEERLDLRAALDFLSTRNELDPNRLGTIGFSAGGTTAAAVAAADARVRALVLVATPASAEQFSIDESGRLAFWRAPVIVATMRAVGIDLRSLDVRAAVARVAPRPVLFIHGELDRTVPVARAQENYRAARTPKELVIFPSAGHGNFLEAAPDDYPKRLIGFFERHLGG